MALLALGVEFKIGELDLSDLVTGLPEIGNGEKEKVEVTTLNDSTRQYIGGISGGMDAMSVECHYDNEKYMALVALEKANGNDNKVTIKFTQDGLQFAFDANVAVNYGASEINGVRSMTVQVTPTSEIAITTQQA
jgi:hypothetical protein